MAENTEPAVATTVAPQPPDVASSEPASKKKDTLAKRAPVAATTKAGHSPGSNGKELRLFFVFDAAFTSEGFHQCPFRETQIILGQSALPFFLDSI